LTASSCCRQQKEEREQQKREAKEKREKEEAEKAAKKAELAKLVLWTCLERRSMAAGMMKVPIRDAKGEEIPKNKMRSQKRVGEAEEAARRMDTFKRKMSTTANPHS